MSVDRSTLCVALALASIAGLGFAPYLGPPTSPIVDARRGMEVPPFSLLDADERKVGRDDLLGHVWVADFIYLQCTDTCPLLCRHMVELLRQTAEPSLADQVHFVSFSVAPEDGPGALRRFLRGFHDVDVRRWHVLAAEPANLTRVTTALGVTDGAARSGGVPISAKLFLIDRRGVVRGEYDGTRRDTPSRLGADLLALARSGP